MLAPFLLAMVLAPCLHVVGLGYTDRVPMAAGSLYDFTDGPTTRTRDLSPSPMLGPLNTTVDALWPTGKWGLAARYPPQTDKVARSANFTSWGSSTELTIELWAKVTNFASTGLLFGLTNRSVQIDVYNPDCPIGVEIALGYLQVWYPGANGECVLGGRKALGVASAVSQNHIALVANSSGFFLYLNGTAFSKSLIPAALPTIIDKSYWLEVFPFHPGYAYQMGSEIYLLAVYKEAVSVEVLRHNYLAGKPPNAVKASDQVVNLNEDEQSPFSIAFTDGDMGDPWVFTITQLPARGTLYYWEFGNSTWVRVPSNWSSTNNLWSYLGNLNDYSKPAPTSAYANFWFSISDGTNTTGIKRAEIRVAPVNDPPVANNATYTGIAALPILLRFSGSDVDIGDGISGVWITTLPGNGSLYQVMGDGRGGVTANLTNNCTAASLPCQVVDIQFRMFYISNPMAESSSGLPIAWLDTLQFIVRDKAPNRAASLLPGYVWLTLDNPLKVAPKTVYIQEDAVDIPDTLVTFVGDFNLDSEEPYMFKLLTLPPKGRLYQLDGTPITSVPTWITNVNQSIASIAFIPPPNDNGDDYARLDYQIEQGNYSSPIATLILSVVSVNDPPSLHMPFSHVTIKRGQTLDVCINITDVDQDGPTLVSLINDAPYACALQLPPGAEVDYTCFNWASRGETCVGNGNGAQGTVTFFAKRSVLNDALSRLTMSCAIAGLTVNVTVRVDDGGEVDWAAEGHMSFEVLKGDYYLRARDLLPTWQRALVWFAVAFVPSSCCLAWCYCRWRKKEAIRKANEPNRIRIEMTADGQQVSTLTDPRTLERRDMTFTRLPSATSSMSSFRFGGSRSRSHWGSTQSFMTGSFTDPQTTDETTAAPLLQHQFELLCKTCGCSATKSDCAKAECKGVIPKFCRHCGSKWTGTYFCQQCQQFD